ncbi:MAG: GxxExxY protein [Saprospiraceae bacterium]|jgi:GxxExxY protein|nr:GxxExxY protein [Saprospiraceae bacterium]
MKSDLIMKHECYNIIGICMEIHRVLGRGLREVVYKDAMEYEFKQHQVPFEREKEFQVGYKDIILKHNFYADFVVHNNLILEVKACEFIHDDFIPITLNYISIAKSPLGLIINFGGPSLEYKRVINSDHL